MARTVQTIYDGMIAEQNSGDFPELNALNSPSNTAIYRLFYWIVAMAINIHETIMDVFQADINTQLEQSVYGTKKWFAVQSKLFQYGDEILFDGNGKPYYAIVDPTLCVVGRVAVVELTDGTVLLKVSQLDGTVLSGLQLTAFTAYIDKIKPAGCITTCTSLNPDQLRITGNYYYDPQFDPADVLTDIEAKINAFLLAIDYNAALYANKVNAEFENCLGYVDWLPTAIEVDVATVWTSIGRVFTAESGNFNIAVTPDDLATTITLIPAIIS